MSSKSFVQSTFCKADLPYETTLRPQSLQEFIGQEEVKDRLHVLLGAAAQRGEPLSHCLLLGPPGLGKTTLAHILAKSMGKRCVVTSGPVIERPADLAGMLTSLGDGDILFIDEIHRLNRTVEEYLYPAMEDFTIDLVIDSGPSARTVQMKLAHFTLVGATTKAGSLTAPMRSRFGFTCRLDYYQPSHLQEIILRAAGILNVQVTKEGALEIATRSRGTPRIANHLLRWVRDFSQMKTSGPVDGAVVDQALSMLAIDKRGLDEMDRKLLSVIVEHYEGGPVGLNTLSAALGEESQTLEEVHEPHLIRLGLLKRTVRGREATSLAFEHLAKESKKKKNRE